MTEAEKRAPAKESAPLESYPTAPSLAATRGDWEARARRVDHALLVVSERRDGVVCSQVFTSLVAAEKKVKRTLERGLHAHMTLVRITPASQAKPWEVMGDDVDAA